jgi:biotin-(acetyl-CoA carboxylase) ligase
MCVWLGTRRGQLNSNFTAARHDALSLQEETTQMTREEQLQAACEHLKEAATLLASTGFSLLAEEVEELALQVDLQAAE